MTPTAQSAGLVAKWRRIAAGDRRDGDEFSANRVEACADELEAALAAPAADGVLVPREPTPEMQHAYFDSIDKHFQRVQTDLRFGRFDNHRIAYKAMLAAAPQAQGEGK